MFAVLPNSLKPKPLQPWRPFGTPLAFFIEVLYADL
jgi:hypothetical protein